MAKSFNNVKGEAEKTKLDWYKFNNGKNVFRIVGGVLPRYVYWLTSPDNKALSIDCLSFDREAEKFTNIRKDWVRHYFPEQKCSWAYAVLVLDRSDGTYKPLGLKKKMWAQIEQAAETLGDPTDIVNGWDIVVEKKKTGPLAFNVEYSVDALQCSAKKKPLTEEEISALEDYGKTIDDLLSEPSEEEVKAFIERVWFSSNNTDDESAKEASKEDFDDDIPF